MRFRLCLGAMLMMAASAPAMADMYLFDGRAWNAGDHPGSVRSEDDGKDVLARAIFFEPSRSVPLTRFVDQIKSSLANGCSPTQRQSHPMRVPAWCE